MTREEEVTGGAMAAVGAAGHPGEDPARGERAGTGEGAPSGPGTGEGASSGPGTAGEGPYGREAADSEDAARPGRARPGDTEAPVTGEDGEDGGTRPAAIALVLLGLVILAVAAFSTPGGCSPAARPTRPATSAPPRSPGRRRSTRPPPCRATSRWL
ncbi:hypothetical protein ACFQ0B_64335 [Nonomuraea thailandensis]